MGATGRLNELWDYQASNTPSTADILNFGTNSDTSTFQEDIRFWTVSRSNSTKETFLEQFEPGDFIYARDPSNTDRVYRYTIGARSNLVTYGSSQRYDFFVHSGIQTGSSSSAIGFSVGLSTDNVTWDSNIQWSSSGDSDFKEPGIGSYVGPNPNSTQVRPPTS